MVAHDPKWAPEQLAYLTWHNETVQYWLYTGIAILILSFALFNILDRWISAMYVRRYHSLHRPKAIYGSGTRRGQPVTVGSVFSTGLAIWRKATYKRGQLVRLFGFENTAQMWVVWVYYSLNLALAFTGAYAHADYQAHHCARLCFANVPLLIGLASKELGVIGWITGLSPATLISFHRWTARLVFFLALFHTFGRIYVWVPPVTPWVAGLRYQAWGIVGLVCWGIMVIGSIRPFRERFYTLFITSHIAAFCASIIALSIHRPQLSMYLVAGAIIYIMDRLVRLVSTAYYALFKPTGAGAGPAGVVEIVSQDTIRVTFRTAMKWVPGAHVFLHAPLLGAGGHPFSIASTYLPIDHLEGDAPPQSANQVFMVRVHTGITLKLYELATQAADDDNKSMLTVPSGLRFPATALWPAFTEGPYGKDPLAHHYETVLLITGGTGVAYAMPILIDLVRRARSKEMGGIKPLVTTRVTFLWTVRDEEQIEAVSDSLRDALHHAPRGFLSLRVFVSGESNGASTNNLGIGRSPHTRTFDSDLSGDYSLAATTYGEVNDLPYNRTSIAPSLPPSIVEPSAPANLYDPPLSSALSQASSHFKKEGDGKADTEAEVQAVPTPDSIENPIFSSGQSLAASLGRNLSTTSDHPSALTPGAPAPEAAGRPPTPFFSASKSEHGIEIPVVYERVHVREALTEAISQTAYGASVSVGTCGPPSLVNEVGGACSDAIEPMKVMRGEHRLNVNLHMETFGW